jgi:AcrR family transcriptional regulator
MSDTRTTILHAAAACIARQGVRGLRMMDVKKEAGVSAGLLYYHFTDRDGLLAATLEYINAAAATVRGADSDPTTDTRDRLVTELLDEVSDTGDTKSNSRAWNEICASAIFDPQLAHHVAATVGAWQQRVADAVRTAQDEGSVPTGTDPGRFAITATALVEGISGRWLAEALDTATARDLLDNALNTLLGPRPNT